MEADVVVDTSSRKRPSRIIKERNSESLGTNTATHGRIISTSYTTLTLSEVCYVSSRIFKIDLPFTLLSAGPLCTDKRSSVHRYLPKFLK
jgi:hypothetical protein